MTLPPFDYLDVQIVPDGIILNSVGDNDIDEMRKFLAEHGIETTEEYSGICG